MFPLFKRGGREKFNRVLEGGGAQKVLDPRLLYGSGGNPGCPNPPPCLPPQCTGLCEGRISPYLDKEIVT